jgi:hypothetical protein
VINTVFDMFPQELLNKRIYSDALGAIYCLM